MTLVLVCASISKSSLAFTSNIHSSLHSTQNLVDYFKAYRAYHGLRNSDSNTSESKLLNSIHGFGGRSSQTIQIGPAHLTFHRTLRVPDNNTNSALPPSLGTFPLEPAENHTERLSSAMKARGGVLLPIMQREAMWIGFNGAEQCAVKISIGGMLLSFRDLGANQIQSLKIYRHQRTHRPPKQ